MTLIGRLIEERMQKPAHDMKASQFEEFIPTPGGVVFLGDSITAGGLWHEWFPGLSTVNRGIDGDTTAGVLARLSTAVAGSPAKVFLLIGTNDLTRRVPPEEITDRVRLIIDRIRAAAPGTHIHLQSVMPRTAKYRDRIRDLNTRYRALARTTDVTYIDLWPALATPDGTLNPDYTLDNLHLGGAGYRAWVDVLREHLS